MSEESAPQQGEEESGLSYGDILASVQIIDVCSNRGAIKGDELVQVGTVRERLVAFLRSAKERGEDIDLPPSAYNAPDAPAEESSSKPAE